MKMADTTTIIRRNRPGTKAKVSYFNGFSMKSFAKWFDLVNAENVIIIMSNSLETPSYKMFSHHDWECGMHNADACFGV